MRRWCRPFFVLLLAGALGMGIPAGAPTRPALAATEAASSRLSLPPPGPSAPRGRFVWPLAGGPRVVRGFGPPAHPYGPGHRGVDLGGWAGEPVLAAGDGVVVFAGPLAGRGVVSVGHAGGLRTTYEPLAPLVAAGARVRRGDVIGVLDAGHPGCPVAVCLHWGLRRGAEYLDPLVLLRRYEIRLLPWDPIA